MVAEENNVCEGEGKCSRMTPTKDADNAVARSTARNLLMIRMLTMPDDPDADDADDSDAEDA